jgi:transcription-repair coupling factor (superfamily II helicase)
MSLYRELDSIQSDKDLDAYRRRMEDRFGPVPPEGEELMLVVLLRRLGRRLGCEKLVLKQHLMKMQFVSNIDSVFYQSRFFDSILNYVGHHARLCDFKEVKGQRVLIVKSVPTVKEAVAILRKMMPE